MFDQKSFWKGPPRAALFFYLGLLLVGTTLVYWSGLHGGFLFDDENNLSQLGAYGRVSDVRSLLFYLTSGVADPVGRPLSLLSFLVDARDWPADPAPFKRTNLCIHLINGALLYWLLICLGREISLEAGHRFRAALLGCALWLLHPLLVSTTMYVVQREAMLPATFTLLGLIAWIEGRKRVTLLRTGGVSLLTLSAIGCTALATLCKANGLLLPVLLLVLDWTLPIRSTHRSVKLSLCRTLLLVVPSLALGVWVISQTPSDLSVVPYGRSWSIGQRLLSQPRVLWRYLDLLSIPRASNSGLFNDATEASTDWFHPWTTLPALVGLVALLVSGLRLRRSQPAAAFAILFFLCGHLLESSVIPLELYFEHRNYLPAMPLFWPLAIWLTGTGFLARTRMALCILVPGIFALLARERADTWGHPFEQAELFAKSDEHSPRALINSATAIASRGNLDVAIARLQDAADHFTDEPQVALNLLSLECRKGSVSKTTLARVRLSLVSNASQADFAHRWILDQIELARSDRCAGFDLNTLQSIQDAVRENKHYSVSPGHLSDLEHDDGAIALARREASLALAKFDRALTLMPTDDLALSQAASFGVAGYPELGLRHLAYFRTLPRADTTSRGMPQLHAYLLRRLGYWSGELGRIQNLLEEDALEKKNAESVR